MDARKMVNVKVKINGNSVDMYQAFLKMDAYICNEIDGTVESHQEFADVYCTLHLKKFGEQFLTE